jgi:hypothetical protein
MLVIYLLLLADQPAQAAAIGIAFGLGRSIVMWLRALQLAWGPPTPRFAAVNRWAAPVAASIAAIAAVHP